MGETSCSMRTDRTDTTKLIVAFRNFLRKCLKTGRSWDGGWGGGGVGTCRRMFETKPTDLHSSRIRTFLGADLRTIPTTKYCWFSSLVVNTQSVSQRVPQPYPKSVLHGVRSSASSFNFQYLSFFFVDVID